MSDSRLEKFIYAICSMDVSDLPVPLSRIEKLWNCLITGETPDFEPLSRNEKYLMAMLDRYDISNLPAPMSRGEKLLYKIAVGETDLSDVPGYLSRYEELLKYLIENGGISGGDFEYVLHTINQSLYTLYTTAEKPVKSAILKGQTLVNVVRGCWFVSEINYFGIELNQYQIGQSYMLILIDAPSNITQIYVGNGIGSIKWCDYTSEFTRNKNYVMLKVTCPSNYDGSSVLPHLRYLNDERPSSINNIKCMLIEYQEGMENWDIPYFDGMQSVKMPVLTTTGKNLFDENKEKSQYYITSNGEYAEDEYGYQYINQEYKVNGGETFSISFEARIGNNAHIRIAEFKGDNFIKRTLISSKKTLTVNIETNRIIFSVDANTDRSFTHLQIEQSTQATSYEPYKTNILTVNEEVELRGIGDVRDELNLMTGELVSNFDEVILTGDERVSEWATSGSFFVESNRTNQLHNNGMVLCVSDKIPSASVDSIYSIHRDKVGIGSMDGNFVVRFPQLTTSDEVSNWLKQNAPIKVLYATKQATIKTVDLTTVDQDNQPTKLGTFENITHVSLESAGLIPELEMEVATHISEELASASPLMDDISTKQEQLSTMVDEQSDNVDATMIATTEIYEETL